MRLNKQRITKAEDKESSEENRHSAPGKGPSTRCRPWGSWDSSRRFQDVG